MAPVKTWPLYFTTSVHKFVLGYSKRDKFIPNYFQLLTIYEIYIYICVCVCVCVCDYVLSTNI